MFLVANTALQEIVMTVLSDLLFSNTRNSQYKLIAEYYYKYWTDPENIRTIYEVPITTCKLCTLEKDKSIKALGMFYDSLPFHSVTLLDAASVTIMSLLEPECIETIGPEVISYVSILNPDIIRNHFFLNICDEKDKLVTDWDVIEILKSLMLTLKTDTVCLRQYANLTKLLKNECTGTCNTFVSGDLQDILHRQQKSAATAIYFISDTNKLLMSNTQSKENTANRFLILFDIMHK